jgi:hypothetical protein
MLGEKEISELKRMHHDLGKRLEKIDDKQRPTVMRLAARLRELLGDIEMVRDKDKNTYNPAFVTRMRLAKKGYELYKDLNQFEKEVAAEFEKGNVPVDEGKRFISIIKQARDEKMPLAKKEFAYFDELLELERRHEATAEELAEGGRALRREQHRLESVLAGLAELESAHVDDAKVRAYTELLENMQTLEKARAEYIDSLLTKPVVELLTMEGLDLPPREELEGLKKFFSDYPEIGRCDTPQLCGYFDYSEKKLSHACPETTRFRRVVAANRSLFESIRSLKQTGFLRVDDNDPASMGFYAARGGTAQKAVESIRQLGAQKQAYKAEYERSREMEKRKEELSRHPKKELEAELAEIHRLLGLLESQPAEERHGLFSAFGSMLRNAL